MAMSGNGGTGKSVIRRKTTATKSVEKSQTTHKKITYSS
jgi:hypothetical protein